MNRQQKKLKRLLNLTMAILGSRVPLTASQLRDMIPDEAYSRDKSEAAFRRTFERDKADLQAIGIPLEVKSHAYGDPSAAHYHIDLALYAERDLRFQPDELAALHIATRLVRISGSLQGSSNAFIKTGIPSEGEIGSILNTLRCETAVDEAAQTSVDEVAQASEVTRFNVGDVPFNRNVSLLASACAKGEILSFVYQRSDGAVSAREVEPWRLKFIKGYWYLTGWDRKRGDERVYRLDRIREGTIRTIGKATHPVGQGPDLNSAVMKPWESGSGERVEVKVLVDPRLAGWAKSVIGGQVDSRSDGSCIFTLHVVNRSALRSLMLDMLEHAEILEPQSVRDDYIASLKKLAETSSIDETRLN